jgi:RecA-family ATPase
MPRVDILSAFTDEPPAQDFVIPGFLAGTVGALVSPGGTGKSFLALQIAAAIASPMPTANTTGFDIAGHGKVLYINLEDPMGEIHRRLHALGRRFDLVTRQSVADSLAISSRVGIPSDVCSDEYGKKLIEAAQGMRLVVIDTLSRSHGGDENDNGAMAQLIVRLETICRETGASVLFLHHTSKAAALNGHGGMQQAARGASALIDNARFSANLSKMTFEEAQQLSERPGGAPIGEKQHGFYLRYETGKQNYGQVQVGRWFKRGEGGILQPVELHARKSGGRGGRVHEL